MVSNRLSNGRFIKTPTKPPAKPTRYWAGYDGSDRNILGFPKIVRIFKTEKEANKYFDIVYSIDIIGEI